MSWGIRGQAHRVSRLPCGCGIPYCLAPQDKGQQASCRGHIDVVQKATMLVAGGPTWLRCTPSRFGAPLRSWEGFRYAAQLDVGEENVKKGLKVSFRSRKKVFLRCVDIVNAHLLEQMSDLNTRPRSSVRGRSRYRATRLYGGRA